MASLTKDSVETVNSAPETAVSQPASQAGPPSSSQTKAAGGSTRSDPVSLEVPVKVHGSRVTEMVRGVTPHTEPFEEQTSTMIVFPQGGVLRMNTSVAAGQMLVLTNLKTKQDAICRVLKVRSFPNMQSYVEVEFTQPQKGYWGVYFPGEGVAPGAPAAKPLPNVAPATVAPPATVPHLDTKKASSDISWAPASSSPAPGSPVQKSAEPVMQSHESRPAVPVVPPPPPPAPAKPVSAFASIGTKEDVQIAADSTREAKPVHAASTVIEKEIRAAQPLKPAAAVEELPAPPKTALSIEELRGDTDEISTVLASLDSEEKSAPEPKPVHAARAATHEPAAVPAFGARLDLGVSPIAAQGAESGQNWMMIAACIAVLVLAVGGGIWYFGQKPSTGQTAPPSIASQPATEARQSGPAVTQPTVTQPTQSSSRATEINSTRTNPAPLANTANSNSGRNSKPAPPAVAPSEPVVVSQSPAEQQPQENAAPSTLAGSNDAHPVSSQRAVAHNAAPSLDPAANSNAEGVLTGIGSNSAAALPPPAPEAPLQVGGKVQAPRLLSSVMPVYPSVAKQAHVEGDVVIDTQIDKRGNVVQMKAVSGPPVLRQAALDAVRRWRYQPSTLDGQPVAIEMMVTVKFHL